MNDMPKIFVLSWQYMYVVFQKSFSVFLTRIWGEVQMIDCAKIVQRIVFVIGLFSNLEVQPRENT